MPYTKVKDKIYIKEQNSKEVKGRQYELQKQKDSYSFFRWRGR